MQVGGIRYGCGIARGPPAGDRARAVIAGSIMATAMRKRGLSFRYNTHDESMLQRPYRQPGRLSMTRREWLADHSGRFRARPVLTQIIALLTVVYLFIYVWAVPMLVLDLVPVWGTGMGGFLLMLQGSLLALWLIQVARWRGCGAGLLIAGLSLGAEYLGVTTGLPFGHYAYTPTLGTQLFGAVPLPIPFAWLMVIPASLSVAALLVRGAARVPVAALLALLLDLAIEPVAAYVVHYWRWLDRGPFYGIPTINFIAWGSTALLLSGLTVIIVPALKRLPPARMALPATLYLLNVVQFTLVDLRYGYVWAALVGCGVLALLVWRGRQFWPGLANEWIGGPEPPVHATPARPQH
ncbi:MAG: hypothetical protein NVS2B7_24820 [Herpetosiphon sp.]